MRVTRIVEMEIEIEDELMPAAIAQATNVLNQAILPSVVRQLAELPEGAMVRLPNLQMQRLEHSDGQVHDPSR